MATVHMFQESLSEEVLLLRSGVEGAVNPLLLWTTLARKK